jgi:hypothetical protein
MVVSLAAAGLIREELDDSELPLYPLKIRSRMVITGSLVRKHHQRSSKLITRESKNGERRKQNAEQKATNGSLASN